MLDLILLLLGSVFIPYQIWRYTAENSGVGVAEKHRENERFWWRFGMVGSVVVGMIGVWIWWKWG